MLSITIHTRRFPPKAFYAITLFPFIFYNGEPMTERDLRHETVHLWQQAALLMAPFYLLYLLFWVVNLVRYHDSMRAYREIPFERSAYHLEKESNSSRCTMAFDWIKQIKPCKTSRR